MKKKKFIPKHAIKALKSKPWFTRENGVMLGILVLLIVGALVKAPAAMREDRENKTLLHARYMLNAISIYYGGHAGEWPKTLDDLVPLNIEKILPEAFTGSAQIKTVAEAADADLKTDAEPEFISGEGGWVYVPANGGFYLNLKGRDSKGRALWKYGHQ